MHLFSGLNSAILRYRGHNNSNYFAETFDIILFSRIAYNIISYHCIYVYHQSRLPLISITRMGVQIDFAGNIIKLLHYPMRRLQSVNHSVAFTIPTAGNRYCSDSSVWDVCMRINLKLYVHTLVNGVGTIAVPFMCVYLMYTTKGKWNIQFNFNKKKCRGRLGCESDSMCVCRRTE